MVHVKRHTQSRSARGRHRVAERARPVACEFVTETDTRYLDQDGDGLLDAVELTLTRVATGDNFRQVLSTERVLMAGVGDDGMPHSVAIRPAE
jgi:hypothetical protein